MTVNLSSFSGSFHDYEIDLDYYHGKDLIHQGCLLKIDPEYSWERINRKIRNKIRQAQKLDVQIKRVSGSPKDIADFRNIWFDPTDDTIPVQLDEDEIMYLAYLDKELVGGLILTPSSPNVLYMHNLGSNEAGKRQNIPALVLWNAVEDLQDTKWEYIDVGVSFRPTLYAFFKNWQTDSYPIIFSPPFIKPDIRLTPFGNSDVIAFEGKNNDDSSIVKSYFGDDFTILPRAIHALKAIMQHIGVTKSDNVAIYKTFENDYISRCVTEPIGHFTNVTNVIDDKTKAVVVVHEFGFPYKGIRDLKKECEERKIPLIEDCAWSCDSYIDENTRIGEVGDFAVFSLPKFLPVQYGAILKGLTIPDEVNWSEYKMLDFFKREIIISGLRKYLSDIKDATAKRRRNWSYLAELFKRDGFSSFTELEEGVSPGAFLVKLDNYQEVFERYEKFGVETGRYYQGSSLYLPVHQNLTTAQLDYLYGVFRGLLNLSSNYSRGGKK